MYKTGYHAKFLANRITLKEASHKQGSIKRTIYDSTIQLNPHQVEAALFAFKADANKGVILADEVGLGKTIEAGLVIAQSWSEMKRRILIVAPNALMKQWESELREKFCLESLIIDSKSFKKLEARGMNPYDHKEQIIITSYGLARSKSSYIERALFDLAILDEAHRIRTKNKVHQELKQALTGVKKILLTATPIQNYTEDLYNLCSFIDSEAFDGKQLFDYRFRHHPDQLKDSIQQYVHRTLRKQVKDYVKYSNRIVQTYNFTPTNEEHHLYVAVNQYLQNENLYLFRNQRNGLIATVVQKQLGSSTAALMSTLQKLKSKLEKALQENSFDIENWEDELEIEDEFEMEDEFYTKDCRANESILSESETRHAILEEIKVLNHLLSLAEAIEEDTRALKLVEALNEIFKGLKQQAGANQKVLIFTESVKTQNYLYHFLRAHGYNKLIRFSGQNNTEDCLEVFEKWKLKHQFSESKSTAMREALVDEFKHRADIMIATEAGSEGLNLQFCSTVINYDLPWNPQRIEQRIGRCHRYGQLVDVTVFNFINSQNQVEFRTYELLNDKFGIFNDLFSSSDSILGLLDEGRHLEKQISMIYRECRNMEEVDAAFNELQKRYRPKIDQKMKESKRTLDTYFDEEISQRFKASEEEMRRQLTELERDFWELSQIQLQNHAYFKGFEDEFKFMLPSSYQGCSEGIYQLHTHFNVEDDEDVILYRTNSALGETIIKEALAFNQNLDYIEFDLTHHSGNISHLNQYKGLLGYLIATKVKAYGVVNQEKILLKCLMENRTSITEQILPRLFDLNGSIKEHPFINPYLENELRENVARQIEYVVAQINEENNEIFQQKKRQITQESILQREAIKGVLAELEQRRDEIEYKMLDTFDDNEQEQLDYELEQILKQLDHTRQSQTHREKEIFNRKQQKLKDLKRNLQYETEELFVIRFKII